jgi:putative peptidoglycan lipid II flippase
VSATPAAVLNARGRFAAPMWAPVAGNLVVIATAAVFLLIGGTGRRTPGCSPRRPSPLVAALRPGSAC